MKLGIIGILIFGSYFLKPILPKNSTDFECILKSQRLVYNRGEVPNLNVSILNKSGRDVFFLGSLDGSEFGLRYPRCKFKIEKPVLDVKAPLGICGNSNPLRKKDFVLVKNGEDFNPFGDVDMYGFFGSYEISAEENFRHPGKYKLTFYYSTKPKSIDKYLGDGRKNEELEKLFEQVPNVELVSNTVEIEIR